MGCVLYTTKPACVWHALEQTTGGALIQLVGRPGLPNEDEVPWLRRLAGDRHVLFLGDSDPADLLIFAWLRWQMPIKYGGVSDRLVLALDVQIQDTPAIPFADSEREAVSMLGEVCPDYRELVGPKCAALLDQGRKIEVEAVILTPGRVPLEDALAQLSASR
jgi:hypothetical protein